MIDIKVPTLGESVTEATVARWMKQPGEAVAQDEPVVELETDKVAVEVPSPSAGVLGEIVANEGDTVGIGAVLARLDETATAGEPAPKQAAPKPAAAEPPAAKEPAEPQPSAAAAAGAGVLGVWVGAAAAGVAQRDGIGPAVP